MSKKKATEKKWPPKHEAAQEKPEVLPEALPVEATQDEAALVDTLAALKGMNREIAEHMAKHGIPDDAYVVQTFYRISAQAAQAVIKVFKEVK